MDLGRELVRFVKCAGALPLTVGLPSIKNTLSIFGAILLRTIPRVSFLVAIAIWLGGCILSGRDIAEDVSPSTLLQVGRYIEEKNNSVHNVTYDNETYLMQSERGWPARFRFFKTPENDEIYIVQIIQERSYIYGFVKIDSNTVEFLYNPTPGNRKLPREYIGHVEDDGNNYRVKTPAMTYKFLREMVNDDKMIIIPGYKRLQ